MKILLININPVVSRLLALCTRDEHIVLVEVNSAEAVEKVSYDILFVDEASYSNDVKALLEKLDVRKKVFISYSGAHMTGFDETIKKPFLPSQIIKVIEDVDMSEVSEDIEEENISIFPLATDEESVEEEVLPTIFPLSEDQEETDDTLEIQEDRDTEILNSNEIEKIKALLDMDDDEIEMPEDDVVLSDDEYEARKVKVIKEKLIADGLEIVEENEIVEELSVGAGDFFDNTKKSNKEGKKKKETQFSPIELAHIEEALSVAIATLKPKKIKKLLKGEEIKIKIKLEDDQ
ncbi:MAG: hypothetical protein OQK45_06390 [Sulfurovum sp.]|nr:hypothetical protein [Sulfurovum sp.]